MEVRIGAKNYECERFGPSEFADLLEWLQERKEDKIIKRAKKVYGAELPDKVFDEINKEISLDDLEDAIASDMMSMCYLIYLAVHKKNPNITESYINETVSTFDDAVRIIDKLRNITAKKKVKRKKAKRKKRPSKKS